MYHFAADGAALAVAVLHRCLPAGHALRRPGAAAPARGRRRLDLQHRRLLLVNGDAEPTDLFLDRRQHGDDRRQRILVLRHESPDVLDVGARALVVAGVALDMLEAHVEDPQRPLDRVELRNGQQLDLGGTAGHGRRTEDAASAGTARLRHRRRGAARTDPGRPDGHSTAEVGSWSEGGPRRSRGGGLGVARSRRLTGRTRR